MAFLALLALTVGAVLLICMGFVGLVEAPWPVLLLLLLSAFYGIQRLSDEQSPVGDHRPLPPDGVTLAPPPVSEDQSSSPDSNQLVYRGVPYKPHSADVSQAGEDAVAPEAEPIVLEGTYRGCRWRKSIPPISVAHEPDN
ncbi:hypothetical protein [Leptolyngbya sp. PCC 6406]|uniref:hypothetical protein n=1 Tax=Leptolyngbya sp. PCC 6406 TaxID=1173264 RepID=UPI0002ABB60A|nr:hypothetical protein [Leptolyngbya sp. PCC 6406]